MLHSNTEGYGGARLTLKKGIPPPDSEDIIIIKLFCRNVKIIQFCRYRDFQRLRLYADKINFTLNTYVSLR